MKSGQSLKVSLAVLWHFVHGHVSRHRAK